MRIVFLTDPESWPGYQRGRLLTPEDLDGSAAILRPGSQSRRKAGSSREPRSVAEMVTSSCIAPPSGRFAPPTHRRCEQTGSICRILSSLFIGLKGLSRQQVQGLFMGGKQIVLPRRRESLLEIGPTSTRFRTSVRMKRRPREKEFPVFGDPPPAVPPLHGKPWRKYVPTVRGFASTKGGQNRTRRYGVDAH